MCFCAQDYQVKEQCRNCTFLNGQFADECEMCGEPLSNSTGQASKSFNKTGGKGKYL
jgi:methionyl-tRNA synthetase